MHPRLTTRSLARPMALALTFAVCGGTAALAAQPVSAADPSPAASPAPLTLLWAGSAPDTTNRSVTVASATDPVSGDIWVAVPFEDKYWILKPDGTYVESWGASGTDPGQLDLTDHAQNPDGWGPIAFAPDGSYVVGDTGNYRVQLFDKDRNLVRQWGSFGTDDGQFVQIVSVATDGQTVAVGDGERWDVQTFDMMGTHLDTFGGDVGASVVDLDGSGHILATNPQNPQGAPMSLTTYDIDGALRSTVDLSFMGGWPVWVAADADGNAFVTAEIDHYPWTAIGTWEYAPDGTLLRQFAEGGDAISLSPTGDVMFVGRGVQLDGTGWNELRAFAIPPLP